MFLVSPLFFYMVAMQLNANVIWLFVKQPTKWDRIQITSENSYFFFLVMCRIRASGDWCVSRVISLYTFPLSIYFPLLFFFHEENIAHAKLSTKVLTNRQWIEWWGKQHTQMEDRSEHKNITKFSRLRPKVFFFLLRKRASSQCSSWIFRRLRWHEAGKRRKRNFLKGLMEFYYGPKSMEWIKNGRSGKNTKIAPKSHKKLPNSKKKKLQLTFYSPKSNSNRI